MNVTRKRSALCGLIRKRSAHECLKIRWPSAPYWHQTIAPAVQSDAPHCGPRTEQQRALGEVSRQDVGRGVVGLNIPDGDSAVYEFDDDMTPIRTTTGRPDAVSKAVQSVANQTRKK